jgi:hypothetical protein
MKTVKDLKVGDDLCFYYRELSDIETVEVSNIVEVSPGKFKISALGVGELHGTYDKDVSNIGFYYLSFEEARKQLISDNKSEITALQGKKRKITQKIN